MMQIKKLTLTHKKDLRVILEDFQLVLNDGDKAVIIGEEGNGKSTLLKWMYDPALTEDYIESTGERIIGKERLGYLPQELPEAEKTKTVYEYFYEKEKFWDQTPKDLAVLARKFGLTEEFFYRDQQMSELSGGEKVKAQMMRLLMEDVTVLLLDEPSNDIDLATLELLEKLIREWEHIVVFISHDETLIENTANMVIHIEQIVRKTKSRYTVAKLPYRTYVEERLQNFERQEQKAQSDRREKALRDEKYRKVYQSVQNALSNCSRQAPSVAKNLKDKMHTVKAMNRAGGSDLLPAWRSRGSHARRENGHRIPSSETGNAGWRAGFGGKYHLKDKRTGKNMHCRPERGRQDNTAEKDCGRAERTGGSPRRLYAAEL